MTDAQAAELLSAVHDLQQQTQALGQLLAQAKLFIEIACVLLLCIMFLVAVHRPK